MGETGGDPLPGIYPRVPRLLLVAGAVAAVIGAIIVLLVTGDAEVSEETRGDLTYIEGEAPQQQGRQEPQLVASIADITNSSVRADRGELLFEVQTAAPVPQPLKTSALELRWDLTGADKSSWTVSVSVTGRETQAAIISGSGYGAGTVDETLPGTLEINGTSLVVRLRTTEMAEFPTEFDWALASTLRAFRNETDSPRVEDRFPNEGSQTFAA